MNKKFLKHYMGTNPEGTAQTYIFLVDNQDIALNIVMSGYQALCLVQEDDGYYFSADSFIEEMRAVQFPGSCQCAYHYVVSCTVNWVNDKLLIYMDPSICIIAFIFAANSNHRICQRLIFPRSRFCF